jgi:gamma-glutamyltranspeptidase / glutathione hydrolase
MSERITRRESLGRAAGILPLITGATLNSDTAAAEPENASTGMVVSVSQAASEVGAEILLRGGNAVDAAIATGFALAVTYPAAGNIGGGGFMLVHPGYAKEPVVFDFRETAPAAATRTMFVDPAGRTAHRRVGVPGTVSGFALAHQQFGRFAWKALIEPAVGLAKEGFALDEFIARSLNELIETSKAPEHAALHWAFGKPDGTKWNTGDRLVQRDLAETLSLLTTDYGADFYHGKTAQLLVDEMRRGGGLITRQDLAAYSAYPRTPVEGKYHSHRIVCAPPPSSGGTTLIEMLNILEHRDLRGRDRWAPETVHLIVEAMRRAYRDRAAHLGDPGSMKTSVDWLIDKDRARELAVSIKPANATNSRELAGEIKVTEESEQTTHYSVIDRNGMAVSVTYTLENSYGSRVVVEGAGFLLNDEMNDFNWVPGVTNTAGRVGTDPNLVAPHKRMLSSMCPTIVTLFGKPVLVTGSPGGRTIINTVLQVILNRIDFEMDLQAAVDAPRLHHQWFPDRVRVEKSLEADHPELVAGLKGFGHDVDTIDRQGDAHSIAIHPRTGAVSGAADKRISGYVATA